jgi:serine/threonine protein kinase
MLVQELGKVAWQIIEATLSTIEDRRRGYQGLTFKDEKAVFPSFLGHLLLEVRNHRGISAVKIPSSDVATDSVRFLREIEAMQQHEHPALIRLLDHAAGNPPAWFAMEYHPRHDLGLEENRRHYIGNPLAALRAIRPIADGLGLLHRNTFVHRDVKPKNIFVGDDGRLVLGDFGIVLPGEDATRMTGATIHSRDWVPDWVRFGNLATYKPVVDVFMLAKVIFFLISGGDNVMSSQADDAFESLTAKYPNSPGLDATLSLLRKCIVNKENQCTIADGAALAGEIDQLLASESIGPEARLLFSFVSADDPAGHPMHQETSRVGGPLPPRVGGPLPLIRGLNGLQVLVARPTREFVARARYFGVGGAVEFSLDASRSERSGLPTHSLVSPGTWSDPIYLRAMVPAGWHELSVGAESETDRLSGFVLYGL